MNTQRPQTALQPAQRSVQMSRRSLYSLCFGLWDGWIETQRKQL